MKERDGKKIRTTHFRSDKTHGDLIFNPESSTTNFVVSNNGRITKKSSFKKSDTITYVTHPLALKLARSHVLKLASDAGEYKDKDSLLLEIRTFIHRYIDMKPAFELITAYYVLLTWVHDQFNELPYLRVRGDYGTGKTRFLQVIGSLSYSSIFASGASTTAPLFHLLNDIGGTLILDESDFRYSDAKADITKILNNGNAKGFSVLRCEKSKDGSFNARAFSIFGPKILASRESFQDDALESRFISCEFGHSRVREDIPVTLPDTFEQEALAIRNMLLKWRLNTLNDKPSSTVDSSSHNATRTSQIYHALLSLVDSQEERDVITQYIDDGEAQLRADRGLATESEVLAILKSFQLQGERLAISTITKRFIAQYGVQYDRRITPKWIGYIIRQKLQLATRKSNGTYIITEGQNIRLSNLYEKYDLAS